MEPTPLNVGVVVGLLLLLLFVLAAVVFLVCRQQTQDDVFPKAFEPKQRNSTGSVQSLHVSEKMSEDVEAQLPNLPRIIVTTASLRQKHI